MLKYAAAASLIIALTISEAKANKYFPEATGKPTGAVEGVLVNFGIGNRAGDVTILQADNQKRSFYIAAEPFIIDGKAIRCTIPPSPRYSPPPDVCAEWPSYLKIGTSRVRVLYWRVIRMGKPALVTHELKVLR